MMISDKFIVKVQIPLNVINAVPMAYIYNEDKTLVQFFEITVKLQLAMGGDPKRFFWAHMDNSRLNLDGFAPWQKW